MLGENKYTIKLGQTFFLNITMKTLIQGKLPNTKRILLFCSKYNAGKIFYQIHYSLQYVYGVLYSEPK